MLLNKIDIKLEVGEQCFVKHTDGLKRINEIKASSKALITSGAVASNLIYVDYDVDASYTAGAVGTRGSQTLLDISQTGYLPISFDVFWISDSSKIIPICFCGRAINNLYVNGYRTTTGAESISLTIRVYYNKIPS